METRFSSSQVVEMTGITPRQLQWWDERGIVRPQHEGHRRLYSLEDVAEIAVICELRSKGFSLQRVRKVMLWLQREMKRRLVETTSANSQVHLLTDGKNIFLEDSERGVIDVLKNARQPLLAVCLSDAVQKITAPRVTGRVVKQRKVQEPERSVPKKKSVRAEAGSPDRKHAMRRVR